MKYLAEYLDDNKGDCPCCREKRTRLEIIQVDEWDCNSSPDVEAVKEAQRIKPEGNYVIKLYKMNQLFLFDYES